MKTNTSLTNKSALGELTLGDVWEAVKDRVDVVRVEDPAGDVFFTCFHLTPRVSLGLSNSSDQDSELEYSFDLETKVKARADHIELSHEDWFGEHETIRVYFLFHPEPQTIELSFLLPGGDK